MMKLSDNAEKELISLAKSGALRNDMEQMRSHWQNPFLKDGVVDVDGYIEFVTRFNEFINHRPKPFKPMIDRVMKL